MSVTLYSFNPLYPCLSICHSKLHLFKLGIAVQYLCGRFGGGLRIAVGGFIRITGFYLHGDLGIVLSLFLQFGCISAHAQYHTDVCTVNQRGCTSFTDERERLSRYRGEPYGYHHVEDGLRYQQQGDTDDEEGGEGTVTLFGDTPHTYQQANVEEDYDNSTYQSELLDDDGEDEIGESLAQEVALNGVSGALPTTLLVATAIRAWAICASLSISNLAAGTSSSLVNFSIRARQVSKR